MDPANLNVHVGDIAKFTCASYSNITWTFNNGPRPKNTQKKSNQLFILQVKRKNAGNYDCYGNHEGTGFVARGVLRVYGKQIIYFMQYICIKEVHC